MKQGNKVYVYRKTYVFALKGNTLVEVPKSMSEGGLQEGKYIIVEIERESRIDPYKVTVWCYEVKSGVVSKRELETFYEKDGGAALLRAEDLAHQC